MAEIELVIKIHEEQYKFLKEGIISIDKVIRYPALMADICERIANGIPLPKGHGRLIDADELKADIHMNKRNKYATQRDVDCTFILLNDASAIIEADKTESEDER